MLFSAAVPFRLIIASWLPGKRIDKSASATRAVVRLFSADIQPPSATRKHKSLPNPAQHRRKTSGGDQIPGQSDFGAEAHQNNGRTTENATVQQQIAPLMIHPNTPLISFQSLFETHVITPSYQDARCKAIMAECTESARGLGFLPQRSALRRP